MKRVIVGITGATGTIYGVRLMELMRTDPNIEIHLVMSRSAKLTLKMEHDLELDYINGLAHEVHEPSNIGASISSGSFRSEGMILVDFKVEFGRFGGELLLGDEFTPDGCRLWDMDTRKKLDKDRFRRGLGGVVEAYEEVAARLGVDLETPIGD